MVNTTIKKFGKEFYRKNTKTKDKFIEEMNIIYKDYNYDFKNINYINNYTKITFICSKHGEISTFPSNLLIGDGCRECKKEEYFLKREKSFFDRLEKIKNPNYDYSMIVYNGMDKNITIKCNIHDYIFQITPKDLLNKRGCKYCGRTKTRLATLNRIENNIKNGFQISPNYNKNACEIFDEISLKENISIQHAMNLGEYYIKELGYWIDGYDKENNVVYEFDEKYHFNKDGYLKEKDLKRQKEIEHFLNCKFIRIKEQS